MLPTGRLELAGRIDDRINLGGIKINPALAESKLRSLDYVQDAAVLMVALPDGRQAVVIAVVFAATGLMERLKKETAASMAVFGSLVQWAELDAIPRTPTGKVQRAALREHLEHKAAA
jgi:acyl-coenzyme A synthetase/AMP-(fatty) acid ligase